MSSVILRQITQVSRTLFHRENCQTKREVRFPRYIIVLISAMLMVVLSGCAALLPSNARDNQDPARQAEMLRLVLKWGRLAPFPANASQISVKTEGSSLTRSFRASFSATKPNIEAWIKNSAGLREATPEKLSEHKVHYQITPGDGANWAEVTIDYALNKVEIYVSWS